MPYGPMGPTTLFGIGVLRYMKQYGLTHEQLAMVSVVQREWASHNPRASYRDPITVEDVLESRMIAYPFHLLECCLVTDGGVRDGHKVVRYGYPVFAGDSTPTVGEPNILPYEVNVPVQCGGALV